ncbi:hypothetical protein N9J03_03505 [Flavobacteriaceae bacterium]|jgi:hypothetical protein|nr:hypothetical protein [Flavobacteriaceae bacterium]
MKKGYWIGAGLCLGIIVGLLTDNLGLWLALGIVLGVAVETTQKKVK